MKTLKLMAVATTMAVALGPVVAGAGTLDDVKARGMLNCVVNTGLAGFSFTDSAGKWQGFDADFCRGLAAAVVGNPNKVKFIPATGKTRSNVTYTGHTSCWRHRQIIGLCPRRARG